MLDVQYGGLFKKDLKRIIKRGCNVDKLKDIVKKLVNNEKLPERNRDHTLVGNYIRI